MAAARDEWDAIALNYTSAPPATPRAWCIITAEPISPLLAPFLPAASRATRSFSGPPRCFTAMAGASPGQQRRLPAPECAYGRSRPARSSHSIREHKVTHFGGAPIVHNLLLNAPAELWEGITHKVKAYIAGAAPPLATIEAMEHHGVELTHVYGLTETYGPATSCVRQEEWGALGPARGRRTGRPPGHALRDGGGHESFSSGHP